jgi:hypothetical protein
MSSKTDTPTAKISAGRTPAYDNCKSCGLLDNVSILIEAGANPFFKNKDKETPLDIAIKRGHLELAVLPEKAEKAAPLIKPEELPARVVQLEKLVEELRQQVLDMTADKKSKKKKAKPGANKNSPSGA